MQKLADISMFESLGNQGVEVSCFNAPYFPGGAEDRSDYPAFAFGDGSEGRSGSGGLGRRSGYPSGYSHATEEVVLRDALSKLEKIYSGVELQERAFKELFSAFPKMDQRNMPRSTFNYFFKMGGMVDYLFHLLVGFRNEVRAAQRAHRFLTVR